jgi:hypothetical protein
VTLDDVLPDPHWRTRHSRRIAAPPHAALAAARAVTVAEMPVAAVLLALRGFGRPPRISFVEFIERRVGLVRLGEDLWAGALRPWHVRGGSRRVGDVVAFAEPGWVKVAVDLTAAGDALATETRILATSDDARRAFGRYWFVVRPGSDLVRMSWLRAAERRVTHQ